QRWTEALAYVATVAGEHSLNWTDEAGMVEKFVTDVSNKLNVTLSRDYDGVVGLQSHFRKLNALLCLECNEVKMIGIWGPAGIGKSTIARALFCSIKEWLQDQRVLIVLDDVDTLDVLAKELSWFGSGSRIIVTTEDKKILKAHGVPDTYQYHVDFPSSKEAVEILCLSAFKHSSPREGFEEVANKVAKLCGNLPLGLCVVGSSLRGESKQEWELQLSRIETSLDAKIIDVLRVGYDRLSKKDQSIFLHLACIFNNNGFLYVKAMLANRDLTYLPRLSMLDLAFYPGKRLPSTFQPECLVTLRMTQSNLEKLWGGILPLANLNEMDLSFSYKLKEMPNLTNATNLETLTLTGTSLVELPSSIKNSHRLKELKMSYCTKLRVIPTNINLASLERVNMRRCSRLRTFPNISSNIEYLDVGNTKIEDVPASVAERWSRLMYLIIGNKSLKRLTHVPDIGDGFRARIAGPV
ncbi:hypothetical protein F2Q69_00040121, partial [Brassica cretica]